MVRKNVQENIVQVKNNFYICHLILNKMSHKIYFLKKNDELIMETQAATVDRALDYFIESEPDVYNNFSKYSIGIKKMPTPNFDHLVNKLN